MPSSSATMTLAPATPTSPTPPSDPLSPEVEFHEPALLHNPVVANQPFSAPTPSAVPADDADVPVGLKEQELLGELQTDEIWWHPKGLVKEDPTKPKKLIGLDQHLLKDVEACLNKKELRYKDRMVEVMAAIEKINEQDVDPNVADVVDTENWSKDELQDEISRLRMLNALLNNNLAAWQLRGEYAEKDAHNMAERLNNLLFHTARAREMALEGSTGVPREERTIHGRAWKFSRGSYPVIGEPEDADDLHKRAAKLKPGGVEQRNLKLGGHGVLWM